MGAVVEWKIGDVWTQKEPFYLPVGEEIQLFEAAAAGRLPVMLKGPTGCGKTRFLEYMAYRLRRPLVTVACHEDLTTADLVGRYLLKGEETVWVDGPLTTAVKRGAICYLDEVVEARKDTIVVIHPLTDDRRFLPLEKKGEVIKAPDTFMLVISYNPGYQTILKDLKQSTKQRFVALEFDFPPADYETEIVRREAGINSDVAAKLVKVAGKMRTLKNRGLEEGVSTRLVIYAATLVKHGIEMLEAIKTAMIKPITDDQVIQKSLEEIAATLLAEG
ncbi:CbbQ/NirQ/NorQ/GpvN family protein [Desulfofundulus thermosubterraneus]|uniref:Nitric oxide reductase NorQ protein n=1 Tax=Desulfofundulus thermosubterraneus DSM 16057 TaxID=1121432 RepID=A0A1M6HWY1_9FIRM|nr:CbbQ/NirQ/NorQ/GpvN family protein [Desulfofundulus thermosubterraneus]SHJ26759.1 nitric oxide reductase NorQ protein [Desulfofundulus thermosubterraneus DSM 16057]